MVASKRKKAVDYYNLASFIAHLLEMKLTENIHQKPTCPRAEWIP